MVDTDIDIDDIDEDEEDDEECYYHRVDLLDNDMSSAAKEVVLLPGNGVCGEVEIPQRLQVSEEDGRFMLVSSDGYASLYHLDLDLDTKLNQLLITKIVDHAYLNFDRDYNDTAIFYASSCAESSLALDSNSPYTRWGSHVHAYNLMTGATIDLAINRMFPFQMMNGIIVKEEWSICQLSIYCDHMRKGKYAHGHFMNPTDYRTFVFDCLSELTPLLDSLIALVVNCLCSCYCCDETKKKKSPTLLTLIDVWRSL